VKGLRTLKGHKIIELEALGLCRATVTDLISCLGEWSLQNLRLLNVTNSTFMDSNKHCVVVALSKLKNLQVLNVANTEFNKTSLVRMFS
jgi:Zyg-11 family protein